MPIAAFGVVAATVLGLGALTAADIQSMDQHGDRNSPFGSHQFGHRHFNHPQPGDLQFPQLRNWMPPGDH